MIHLRAALRLTTLWLTAVGLMALLVGCGARKPKTPTAAPASVPSAAPETTPAWVELPSPIAPDAPVVSADAPTQTDGPRVFPNATDLFTLEQNHRASMAARNRDDRADHAFWVIHPEGDQAERRQVHCSTARVIVKERGALSRTPTGVEADAWVLWVDPATDSPKDPQVIGLSMYRHLVKYHLVAYRGRVGGLALYQYLKPRPVPEGS